MTDDVAQIILEHLRIVRGDLGAIRVDVGELKARMTSLEIHVARIDASVTLVFGDTLHVNGRIDDLSTRVGRI